MSKFISVILAVMLGAGVAYAAPLNVIETGTPNFVTPSNTAARSISLGTKGYGCYSTNLGAISRKLIMFRCHNTATGADYVAGVSVNSPSNTKYHTVGSTWRITSGITKVCFTAISSATAASADIIGE